MQLTWVCIHSKSIQSTLHCLQVARPVSTYDTSSMTTEPQKATAKGIIANRPESYEQLDIKMVNVLVTQLLYNFVVIRNTKMERKIGQISEIKPRSSHPSAPRQRRRSGGFLVLLWERWLPLLLKLLLLLLLVWKVLLRLERGRWSECIGTNACEDSGAHICWLVTAAESCASRHHAGHWERARGSRFGWEGVETAQGIVRGGIGDRSEGILGSKHVAAIKNPKRSNVPVTAVHVVGSREIVGRPHGCDG